MDTNKQTDAVFKSVRTEVDPVSGNEVPPGALPEEVRDDIDAKLSEGEYVVPADVLRYYGLKFFEDLRNKAKTKMEDLDAGGRIGGEPVMDDMPAEEELPFDIRELRVREEPSMDVEMQMAEGGLVSGYADGGDVYDSTAYMVKPDFLEGVKVPGAASSKEVTKKIYVNAEGQTINVDFVNGKPVTNIPPGYRPSDSDVTPDESNSITEESDAFEYEAQQEADQKQAAEMRDRFKGMSASKLMEHLSKSQKMTEVGKGIGMAIPGGSLLAGVAGRAEGLSIAREARKGFMNATTQAEKDAFAKVHDEATTRGREEGEGIFGGGGLFGGGGTLTDVNNDGKVNFGDTALGDFLGFDGKAGIADGAPGFKDSFYGARREGGTGKLSMDLGDASAQGGEAESANDDYDMGLDTTDF